MTTTRRQESTKVVTGPPKWGTAGASLRRMSRVRSLAVAAALVGVEALACLGAAVGFLIAVGVGKPADRGVAATLAALLFVFGAGLALDARGLWRSRPPAQTPAYVAQFFALVVAWYQRHTLPAVTAAIVVLVVATVAALSAKETRDALRR